ncbi:GNAT family N-acetyltransferase [Pseudomonas sp. MRSN 12121]|uniref:GNAT family N-acetyltransferase n=1 Tax=Pseudomonas sp. MRSN 12121 TaxID=1611770 RepID=UPI0005BEAAD1|nr:GNAT family N-acetyltransferase [Pseudomonas sp. MRSN 12121]AJO78451.1 acetyltransferase domain protein [Pseudomonas sp. MRSN 12121]
MQPTPTLHTARLILRPLQLADAEAIQQQFAHWDVVRYLNARVPWPYPADGALSFLRDNALPAMARGEAWHWSIRLQDAPEQLIGSVSLMNETDNHRGFWLGPAWRGHGYMSEACAAVTEYWFEVLDRDLMRVPKAAPNLASRRISERSGMRLVGSDDDDFVCGRLPRELWEITREEWRRRR